MSSNWETVKLGDVTKFQQGKQIELEDQFLEPTNEMLRFVRIIDYTSENEPPRYIKADKKSSSYVTDEDVVMIRYGSQTAGKVVIGKAGIIANNMFRVIPTVSYLDRKYLYFYLKTPSVYSYLRGGQSSSTMPAITFGLMSSLDIKIPPLPIQKKIAHILSTLDDKIELNRKMNQTLESMASAIFKSWFVDFDPVHAKANCEEEAELENIAKELGISKTILDLFPSEFEESELGMIPNGWKIINFKDLVEKYIDNRGKTPPLVENGIPLLEVRTLPNEMLSSEYLTDKCVSDEIYNTWFRSHLETDDILISTVGTIGLTSIVPPNSKFVIAQNVLGIRANEEFILKKFMFYLMKSKFFIDAINARLVTTVQSSIKRKDMETINIIIPDFSTQKEFVKIVTPIMEKMQSNEILNLKKTRDTLLPKLLSGEIDVSDLSLEME